MAKLHLEKQYGSQELNSKESSLNRWRKRRLSVVNLDLPRENHA